MAQLPPTVRPESLGAAVMCKPLETCCALSSFLQAAISISALPAELLAKLVG